MPDAVHADQRRLGFDPPVVRDPIARVQRGLGGAVLEMAAWRLDLDGLRHGERFGRGRLQAHAEVHHDGLMQARR
ncbi:MAG TPA: hypothetical protein VE645_15875 [Pseudonocardiaceae bacterium]|nr:hypothetical protein [Pseudonocardiaceae bacterium]